MTPTTQETVTAEFPLRRPTGLKVTDERITWTGERVYDESEGEWPGTESMLREFTNLASAQPEKMAAWLESYGILSLCGHGHPVDACVLKRCAGMLEGGTALSVRSVRDVALAFQAALRLASHLRQRKPGDSADWMELQNLLGGGVGMRAWEDPDLRRDWRLRQEQYAFWLELCFERCGVGHAVEWRSRQGLRVAPKATDLLGVLVILLYRESASGRESFHCDNCGTALDRARQPRRGERVYCAELACQRARHRENQRRSREAKR